jgi:hypothetical protein
MKIEEGEDEKGGGGHRLQRRLNPAMVCSDTPRRLASASTASIPNNWTSLTTCPHEDGIVCAFVAKGWGGRDASVASRTAAFTSFSSTSRGYA